MAGKKPGNHPLPITSWHVITNDDRGNQVMQGKKQTTNHLRFCVWNRSSVVDAHHCTSATKVATCFFMDSPDWLYSTPSITVAAIASIARLSSAPAFNKFLEARLMRLDHGSECLKAFCPKVMRQAIGSFWSSGISGIRPGVEGTLVALEIIGSNWGEDSTFPSIAKALTEVWLIEVTKVTSGSSRKASSILRLALNISDPAGIWAHWRYLTLHGNKYSKTVDTHDILKLGHFAAKTPNKSKLCTISHKSALNNWLWASKFSWMRWMRTGALTALAWTNGFWGTGVGKPSTSNLDP